MLVIAKRLYIRHGMQLMKKESLAVVEKSDPQLGLVI
jgi:hypothetical protein